MTLDTWQEWEGRVVGGRFALGSYLGGSDHSAVYLTDFGGSRAVVKLVAADTADAEAQLARWETACRLAHPNLLRVYDTGLWHADEEQDMFFAVIEHGDENLAEILAERALTPAEAREMIESTLTALGHLHLNNLVHCDLKPSNVLAVGQELKLAVDGVRRTGSRVTGREQDDWRAAPEVFNSSVSARNDIWALGLLIVESLTRQRPVRDRSKDDEIRIPELPEPFASIAKECLQRDPAKRCSNAQIRKMLERPIEVKKPEAQVVAMPPQAQKDSKTAEKQLAESKATNSDAAAQPKPEASGHTVATQRKAESNSQPAPAPTTRDTQDPGSKVGSPGAKSGGAVAVSAKNSEPAKVKLLEPQRESGPTEAPSALWMTEERSRFLPFAIALFVAVIGIAVLAWFFTHRGPDPSPAPSLSQQSQPTEPTLTPVSRPVTTSAAAIPHSVPGTVTHQVMPEISRTAQNSIHGVVKVRVQVNVNESGAVTLAGLTAHGPSRYFAKQALEAAREWTFSPPLVDGRPATSRWILEFDFRRSGVKAESKLTSPRA